MFWFMLNVYIDLCLMYVLIYFQCMFWCMFWFMLNVCLDLCLMYILIYVRCMFWFMFNVFFFLFGVVFVVPYVVCGTGVWFEVHVVFIVIDKYHTWVNDDENHILLQTTVPHTTWGNTNNTHNIRQHFVLPQW